MAYSATICLGLVAATFVWYFSTLPKNYFQARKTGYPILISPVSSGNPLWLVFARSCDSWMEAHMPTWLFDHFKVAIYGWEFTYRYDIHAKLGKIFIHVTPGGNEIYIADPDIAVKVLARRRDFVQLDITTRIMGFFGMNITASNGDEWQRHRKIVAPVLNERIMGSVWEESTRQTSQMVDVFSDESKFDGSEPGKTDRAHEGIRTIAINVIAATSYGSHHSWAETQQTSTNDDDQAKTRMTFMESILHIVNNHIPAVFLPQWLLSSPVMPKSMQTLGAAARAFPAYSKELIAKERSSADTTNTLMSTLVKICDSEQADSKSKSTSWLTEDEITGNLFNFAIAGFDTTSNTSAYALTLLAIEPKWQNWIIEEIDRTTHSHPEGFYDDCYPELVRCLALMFETLRLYSPLLHITRDTLAPQTLEKEVPVGTKVYVAQACIHVSPEFWGPDPLTFRPTRWLTPEGKLVTPTKGTFLPWSTGPRVCPGLKMAQVEFVAIFRELFSKARVEAGTRSGESIDVARERLQGVLDSSQPKFTLTVRNPRDVVLKFVKR